MYGIIHKAARAFAIEQLGEPFWTTFATEHELTDAAFVLGESYSDDVTFGVIVGLAEAMDMPVDDFLRAFGRHWIEFARQGAFAHLMSLGGETLPAFIRNLNRMHAGLAVAMPGARMPSFYVMEDTPQAMRLRYVSDRPGLEPFVLGLLEGLCAMFGVEADVARAPDDGVIFDVLYRLSAAA
jgi:hypothetical protein